MKTKCEFRKRVLWKWSLGCAALLLSIAILPCAAASSSESNVITVDTTTAGITVAGRVLDGATRLPLSGATVTLSGQSTSSTGAGQFSFAGISLSGGSTLSVSKSGYATYQQTADVPPGSSQVTLPDIHLQPLPQTPGPVVTGIQPEFDGIFLSGVPLYNTFTAAVDWRGATPGAVRFYANDQLINTVSGAGPDYRARVNMGAVFSPSLRTGSNRLRVIAENAEGAVSAAAERAVSVIPLPSGLTLHLPGFDVNSRGGEITASVSFDIPKPPVRATVSLPVLGEFGAQVGAQGAFEYSISSGAWEASLGAGGDNSLKLLMGPREVSGYVTGGLRGTATVANGIQLTDASASAGIAVKFELARVGPLEVMFPGISTTLSRIWGLNSAIKAVSVLIYAEPGISGQMQFALDPSFSLRQTELTGHVGLIAAYEPNLVVAKMDLYIGGRPSVTFQAPGPFFKELRFKVYSEVKFETRLFTLGPYEYVFIDREILGSSALQLAAMPRTAVTDDGVIVMRVDAAEDGFRPMDRAYLKEGPARFVAYDTDRTVKADRNVGAPGAGTFLSAGEGEAREGADRNVGAPMSALEAFRSVGRKRTDGGIALQAAEGQQEISLAQAELPLVENAFPNSAPALAGRGNELMLLYVTDNGQPEDLQFTDIAWTYFDGTDWTVPAGIQTDTRAEFNPQVAFDGHGDAIAVWERVKSPDFNEPDLEAMAAELEIVWARWNRVTKTWSEPAALTNNDYLDHAPLLAGPMANGDLLLVWTKNESNLLMGTNGAGSQVLSAQWDSTSRNWSAPLTLIADMPYQTSQSLAGSGNRAVYVWTQHVDGDMEEHTNQEVFHRVWEGGEWGIVTRHTDDAVADQHVRAAVADNGEIFVMRQREGNLVLERDFSGDVRMARGASDTIGFSDYTMTFGPAGNLVVIWQEMSETGPDAHYMVYDPVSDTWSRDARFFHDEHLERSFAAVWDDAGNLTMAYNKVQIVTANKTVTLEDGTELEIENVPQPGRVDLEIMKRALIKDVALLPGDFRADGLNFLPGDAVTLTAEIRNLGDVAVQDVAVAFYEGDPTDGGTLIDTATVNDWVEGANTAEVSVVWVVPEPALPYTLYAVVNRGGGISEFDETNNTQSLSVGGTDLAATLVSATPEPDGSARVIVRVHNLGAPASPESVLAIRREGGNGSPLATVQIPILEPGRLAQVAIDLPAGTQPEGLAHYTLTADETDVTSDVNPANNTTTFAVNLWVDSLGNGLPDWWEMLHFGELGVDPDADADSDGMSNRAEYFAGTDPKDTDSYLRIMAIGEDEEENGGSVGIRIAWGSKAGRLYAIERSEDLGAGFVPIARHILASPPENVFVDSTAADPGMYFYRIRVE